MATVRDLKEFRLFKGLDDEELGLIATLVNERSLKKGTVCFKQGSPASELHLCRKGKVDIVVHHFEAPTVYVRIHTAGEGEAFGWSALVEPCKYTASAVCAEDTVEYFLRQADLFRVFFLKPRMGFVFMRNLAALISSRVTEYQKRMSKDIALDIRNDYEW